MSDAQSRKISVTPDERDALGNPAVTRCHVESTPVEEGEQELLGAGIEICRHSPLEEVTGRRG